MNALSNTVPRTAYSLNEAAASLGVSRRMLYELMDAGKLATVRIGRRRIVPAVELVRLVTPRDAGLRSDV